jgi:AraC-like DNA-binding protein
MEAFSNWDLNVVFFTGILGFLVAGILIFVNNTDTFASRLFAGFLICFSLLAVNYALMTTRFYLSFPHLWRVFGWASFSFAPLAFLYTRSILDQSFKFKKWDFLFFLPALLHIIGLIPFYILPAPEKVEFLEKVVADPKLITLEPESLWPDGSTVLGRVVVGVLATLGQIKLLAKWKKQHSNGFITEKQNVVTFRWLFLFTVVMSIFWGLIVVEMVLHFTTTPNLNAILISTISGTILFVSLYLLVQPSILYGIRGWERKVIGKNQREEVEKPAIPEEKTQNRDSLSYEQGKIYKNLLETHLNEKKSFRKRGYTMAELSKELGLPSYIISAFINQEYGKNFNELFNEYRVNYLIGEMRTSVDYSQYTLEALGNLAGFNSRAAFIAAVKKTTGKTPSEVFGRRV